VRVEKETLYFELIRKVLKRRFWMMLIWKKKQQ